MSLLPLLAAATARAARSPLAMGLLCLLHLVAAGASWRWAVGALEEPLAGHPAPDLFAWVVMVQRDPAVLQRLLTGSACALTLNLLFGALAAALILGRWSGRGAGAALRGPFVRLIALRLLALLAAAAILAGAWFSLVPLSRTFHQLDNELLIMALHLASALPFALVLLPLLCLLHYAQALLVRRRLGLLASLRAGLALIHGHPLAAAGAWSVAWLAWLAVGCALLLPGAESPLLAQLAALLRVGLHLWMLAAAHELDRGDGPAPDPAA